MRHKGRELEIQRKNKRERQKERVITRGRGAERKEEAWTMSSILRRKWHKQYGKKKK